MSSRAMRTLAVGAGLVALEAVVIGFDRVLWNLSDLTLAIAVVLFAFGCGLVVGVGESTR